MKDSKQMQQESPNGSSKEPSAFEVEYDDLYKQLERASRDHPGPVNDACGLDNIGIGIQD